MATYIELFNLRSNNDLRNKITVAVVVKAQALIVLQGATAAQISFADATLKDPVAMMERIMSFVLAANKAFTPAQILAADDSTIQGHVNTACDNLIAGGILG